MIEIENEIEVGNEVENENLEIDKMKMRRIDWEWILKHDWLFY